MSTRKKKVTRQNAFGEIQQAFLTALTRQPEAMTDVIHAALEIPSDCCMKVGAAIADLARQGLIERVGFTRTERSKAHGRHVSLWRLVK